MASSVLIKAGLSCCVLLTVVTGSTMLQQNKDDVLPPHAKHRGEDMDHQQIANNLQRSYLRLDNQEAITPPALLTSSGASLSEQLSQAWSLVFFGFTSCPDVCPRTLSILAKAGQDPAGDIANGDTQVLFVTVDPETDSLRRIDAYLNGFHPDFLGYTGHAADLTHFANQLGAAFSKSLTSFDHSTSVYVIDSDGRVRGILLSPTSSSQMIADLTSLKQHEPGVKPHPMHTMSAGI
jgi:cytochrome oxidase Cu insertion factor (SCO1/SenC/PrrC family)